VTPACVSVSGSTLKAPALEGGLCSASLQQSLVMSGVMSVLFCSSRSFAEQLYDSCYALPKEIDILLHTWFCPAVPQRHVHHTLFQFLVPYAAHLGLGGSTAG